MEKFLMSKIERWYALLLVLVVFLIVWLFGSLAVIRTSTGEKTAYSDQAVRFFLYPRKIADAIFPEDDTRFPLADLPDLRLNRADENASGPDFLLPVYEKSDGEIVRLVMRDPASSTGTAEWRITREALAFSPVDDTILISGEQRGYAQTDRIAKARRDGTILWEVDIASHHQVSVDGEGRIYTPTLNAAFNGKIRDHYKGLTGYRDDGYAILSPDGKIIDQRSLTQILADNGLLHLIYGVGPIEADPIHLNSIKVAEEDLGIYRKGDLLMSLRHLSMVLLYRPSTNRIVWYSLGPWLNQHDPDFLPDGRIAVFGNDVTSSYFNRVLRDAPLVYGHNDIYIVDPATGEIERPYTEQMKSIGLATTTRGAQRILPDGSVLVHFTNQGVLSWIRTDGTVRHYALIDGDHADLISGLELLVE